MSEMGVSTKFIKVSYFRRCTLWKDSILSSILGVNMRHIPEIANVLGFILKYVQTESLSERPFVTFALLLSVSQSINVCQSMIKDQQASRLMRDRGGGALLRLYIFKLTYFSTSTKSSLSLREHCLLTYC